MGHRGLLASARGAPPCRRIPRRSLRTAPCLLNWRGSFRCGVRLVWTCYRHSSTDCSAWCPGARRGAARSGQSRNHQQFVSGERTWPRHRYLVGFQRDYDCHRASNWRLADRTHFVARCILHQCSNRAFNNRNLTVACSGKLRQAEQEARLVGRDLGSARSGRLGLRINRIFATRFR